MAWTLTPTHPVTNRASAPGPIHSPELPSLHGTTSSPRGTGATKPRLGHCIGICCAKTGDNMAIATELQNRRLPSRRQWTSSSRHQGSQSRLETRGPITSRTDGHVTVFSRQDMSCPTLRRTEPEDLPKPSGTGSLSRTVDAERVSFLLETETVTGARGPRGRLGYAMQTIPRGYGCTARM